MRVCVAGPRDLFVSPDVVGRALEASGFEVAELVFGDAKGVDRAAYLYAEKNRIDFKKNFAHWDEAEKRLGNRNAAGPIRNSKNASESDALVVIRRSGQRTSGTADMHTQMLQRGAPVHAEEV